MAQWTPNSNDRFFFAGPTGKGKTTTARKVTAWWNDIPPPSEGTPGLLVLWIDSKRAEGLSDIHQVGLEEIGPELWGEHRWVPPPGDLMAEPAFERVWRRGSTLVLVDELSMVATEHRPGKWLRALYQQGREPGIGVGTCTQDPVRIPKFTKSQAEHRLIWPIRDPDYQSDMARLCHVPPEELAAAFEACEEYDCVLSSDQLPKLHILPADW